MTTDLYELLGVSRDASQEDIKRAYRRRARELHPDAGGDENAFKEVSHAYEVLSDPQRRARYDRFGDDGRARTGDPFGFGQGFGGLGDVIEAFFGGGSGFRGGGFGGQAGTRTRRHAPGRDVLVGVELDLEDVAAGVQREVTVDAAVACQTCGGSGSRSGGQARCTTCGGAGQVRRVVRSSFGQLATARACPDCEGTGRGVADPCPDCGGDGRRRDTRRITVDIPPGVEDGDRLRVAGAGEAGRRGAAAGDLYVQIGVRPHDIFEREGRDLWCDVSVPFVQAALGATLEVPTLTDETVTVDLPTGTQPGDVLTVPRGGIPRRAGHDPGDLHVRVGVEVPRRLSEEEQALLQRLAEIRGEETPPQGKGLFQRLRRSFR